MEGLPIAPSTAASTENSLKAFVLNTAEAKLVPFPIAIVPCRGTCFVILIAIVS